jgi:hypothetical protein
VLAQEIGTVSRFGGPGELASYAGLVGRAIESAEWKRPGGCPKDCNHDLKWAYVGAANWISIRRKPWADRHVVQLYERVKKSSKMHGKATVAGARHLAEASYWMLEKQESYREPNHQREVLSSMHG